MSVEGIGRLEAQGVPRTEPDGHQLVTATRRHQGFPSFGSRFAREIQLEAVGAGVTRARDQNRGVTGVEFGKAKTLQRSAFPQPPVENPLSARALQGEECGGFTLIGDVAILRVLLDPGEILLDIRCVDADEETIVGHAIDGDVVDDAAFLVAEAAVADLARAKARHGTGEQVLEARLGARSRYVDLAHVRNVEEASLTADGVVLGDDRAVLNGHRETGEGHHSSAGRSVQIEERSALQRLTQSRDS